MTPREVLSQGYIRLFALGVGLACIWLAVSRYTKQDVPLFMAVRETRHINLDQFIAQQQRYLEGGKLSLVTFPAQLQHGDVRTTITRKGMLYLTPHAKATIVVCHGFMCDKFDISFVRKVLFPSYNVFAFDFRAHGELVDPLHCCTFGRDEALDVMGAVRFIKSRPDLAHLPIIGYGFSMGAVAAIQAQAQDNHLFKALILDCPYDKSKNVVRRSLEHLKFTFFGYTFGLPGKSLLRRFAFHPLIQGLIKRLLKTIAQLDALTINTQICPLKPVESVKNITVPCFFIHCLNDEKIDKAAAHQLFNNARGYKRLWVTNGRRHFDSIFYNPEKYAHKVGIFINNVLNGTYATKVSKKIHYDQLIVSIHSTS